ncbi:MAG: hypothetical protein K1W25_04410, partial [Lachnospiraceae bacterium]
SILFSFIIPKKDAMFIIYSFMRLSCSVSGEGLEDNEQLEVVLADRTEIARILKEENVSMNCGYLMMHFLHHTDEDPFYFLKPGPLQKE